MLRNVILGGSFALLLVACNLPTNQTPERTLPPVTFCGP